MLNTPETSVNEYLYNHIEKGNFRTNYPRFTLQKKSFSDQLNPVGKKPHVKEDLSVKNTDATS